MKVIEIIPPAVETALDRALSVNPPPAMKLDAFVSAAMAGLDAGREEIPVGLAKVLRTVAHCARILAQHAHPQDAGPPP